MATDRVSGGFLTMLAAALTVAVCAPVGAADTSPPIVVSKSSFIKFADQPWLLACEWTGADGKSKVSWTEGLAKPDEKIVPANSLCTKVRRYNFAGGHNFLYAGFEKNRPTPVQTGHLTNFMYVLSGRGHSMVDGQTIDSVPGDVLAQMGDKPHQTEALTDDYAQFDVISIPALPDGQGFKMTDADVARGNLIRHADVMKAKEEVCLGKLTDGHYRRVEGTPPPGAPCFTVLPLVTRPAAKVVELHIAKTAITQPHKEGLDRVMYVVKGTVKAQVGDEKAVLTAGDAMLHPTDVLHAEEYAAGSVVLEISYPKLD